MSIALACATAFDEEQVSDEDALTNGDGVGGESSTSSTNTVSSTPVVAASNNNTATIQASSTMSTSTNSTNTSGEAATTMAASNTSSTSGGGDGGTAGGTSTDDANTTGMGGMGGTVMGAGGTTTMGGVTGMGMGGTAPGSMDCPDPQAPTMGTNSGEFGTTGEVCYFVPGDEIMQGWGCSNTDGRTITVNGTTVMCGDWPLPSEVDGGYYFAFTAGEHPWAQFYWY